MAIDCCEHTLTVLERLPKIHLLSRDFKIPSDVVENGGVDLIVIGLARHPVRRFFISELRRFYSELPILVLRREQVAAGDNRERVRGEFVLSDQSNRNDCEIVCSLRKVMPFPACSHVNKTEDYDTVREVMRLLARMHTDPQLSLKKVAGKMPISPKRLSIILNNHVGVSFRQLLRHVRIEEAKRMLRTRRYSVKEVAAHVGFSDSHHFSRSFKEMTGQNASEYQEKSAVLS